MKSSILVVCAILVGSCHQAIAQQQAKIVKEEFFASEQGGFGIKLWKEAGSQEVQALITAACAAYGVDCSAAAAGFRTAMVESRNRISVGNYEGTARIDRHPGEEYYAKFDSPGGMTICKAGIDIINGSISGGATFNGTIQRTGEDGLGLYVVVPKNRPEGQWVNFKLLVEYVPAGQLDNFGCWPNNTWVFQCAGPNNCKANPNYPAAYLKQ
ncbi:hypothetical protein [Bradyrhizobium liaoningense]|uniref:hypothetical protein n=1 Tax=Bradyrhizobium liaoningense TaxID=43992 RepID=UPI001BA9BDAA|nr:hypothetical protein [Bradyrhizobium liaoningense]MBR1071219.1 hypothetical protein [Bradyrhizobium liaoningense]